MVELLVQTDPDLVKSRNTEKQNIVFLWSQWWVYTQSKQNCVFTTECDLLRHFLSSRSLSRCPFSCRGVRFHPLLAALPRGAIFILQVLRAWLLGDCSDQPILQPGFLCPLLPQRCHQSHSVQHHVQEVPRGGVQTSGIRTLLPEEALHSEGWEFSGLDRV